MATIEDGWRALDDLRQNPSNYNEHTKPGVIEKMAARIRCNVFTAPIIIRPDGTILGGHLRRLGLLKLRADSYPEPEGVKPGWLVPVRVFHGTPTQERAILVGDNPDPADINFDDEKLAALLAELQQEGALETAGYREVDLDALLLEIVQTSQSAREGGGAESQRKLGDRQAQVKPVLYLDEVATFEQAIAAVGEQRRAEALLVICRFYLENHAAGQLDVPAEGDPAPEGIGDPAPSDRTRNPRRQRQAG